MRNGRFSGEELVLREWEPGWTHLALWWSPAPMEGDCVLSATHVSSSRGPRGLMSQSFGVGREGCPWKMQRTLLLVILENTEHAPYRFVAPLICCKSRTLSLTLELLLLWCCLWEPTRGSPSAIKSSGSRSSIKSFHLFIYLDVDYLKSLLLNSLQYRFCCLCSGFWPVRHMGY